MGRNARPLNEVVEMLLPTPRATDGTHGGPNQRGSSGDLMLPSAVMDLLPTPRAARGASGTETMYALGAERTDEGRPQGEVLLPTPTGIAEALTSPDPSPKSSGSSVGDLTPQPLTAGSKSSAAQHPGQLSLGELESA
jgi:hypothetical protein